MNQLLERSLGSNRDSFSSRWLRTEVTVSEHPVMIKHSSTSSVTAGRHRIHCSKPSLQDSLALIHSLTGSSSHSWDSIYHHFRRGLNRNNNRWGPRTRAGKCIGHHSRQADADDLAQPESQVKSPLLVSQGHPRK